MARLGIRCDDFQQFREIDGDFGIGRTICQLLREEFEIVSFRLKGKREKRV